MTRLRGRVLTALVLLLPPAVGTMVHLVTRNHLPDRIPFPWDWSGGRLSDGMGGSSASFYLTNVYSYVVVGIALLLVAANRRGKRSRSAILGGGVASAMAFSFWAKTELVAYGAPALSAVDIEPWQTLLSVIAIGAYGWLLQSVMPVEPQQDRRAPESKLEFQPSLRVLWTGRAVNRVKLWVVGALVGGSVGVAAFTASAAVALLIVAGWLWWGYLAKARIGNAGVSISRVAGWPTHHLPLDRVTRARTQTVRPNPLSGRIRDHDDIDARSIICRTGETLVVEGYDHLPLYVSIDNAAEAADVLNALVVRSRAAEVPA